MSEVGTRSKSWVVACIRSPTSLIRRVAPVLVRGGAVGNRSSIVRWSASSTSTIAIRRSIRSLCDFAVAPTRRPTCSLALVHVASDLAQRSSGEGGQQDAETHQGQQPAQHDPEQHALGAARQAEQQRQDEDRHEHAGGQRGEGHHPATTALGPEDPGDGVEQALRVEAALRLRGRGLLLLRALLPPA